MTPILKKPRRRASSRMREVKDAEFESLMIQFRIAQHLLESQGSFFVPMPFVVFGAGIKSHYEDPDSQRVTQDSGGKLCLILESVDINNEER